LFAADQHRHLVQMRAGFHVGRARLALDSGDRISTAAILLEQRIPLPSTMRFRVKVHEQILKPSRLADAPPHVISFEVMGQYIAVSSIVKT
jgi:hypothetical protein